MWMWVELRRLRFIYQDRWTAYLNRRYTIYSYDVSKNTKWVNRGTGKCRWCSGVIYEFQWGEISDYPRLCERCRMELRNLHLAHEVGNDPDEIPF